MIEIRPIHPHEIPQAKHIILSVAYRIYGWKGTLEDSVRHFEGTGEFRDMDEVQSHYFDNNGLFLAALDDGKLIGSGAIRKWDATTAELKRMWLLEDYHGRGIGYQLITRLFDFARTHGYHRIFLQTGSEQSRAVRFYRRLGFVEIPTYNNKPDEISMQIELS
jgi:putative acetyltransferase